MNDSDMRTHSRNIELPQVSIFEGTLCGSTALPFDYAGCGETSITKFFDPSACHGNLIVKGSPCDSRLLVLDA